MMMLRVLQLDATSVLFGQVRRGYGQQADTAAMVLWLGIALAAVGIVSVAVYFAHRAAIRRRLNSHPRLFDALCKLHRLPRHQRILLRQVVRARNMAYPAQVFIEPGCLDVRTLPEPLRGSVAELGKMNKKLFS